MVIATGYPRRHLSSGMNLKFMPQMPANAVNTAKIAAHAASQLVDIAGLDGDHGQIAPGSRWRWYRASCRGSTEDAVQVVVDVAKIFLGFGEKPGGTLPPLSLPT